VFGQRSVLQGKLRFIPRVGLFELFREKDGGVCRENADKTRVRQTRIRNRRFFKLNCVSFAPPHFPETDFLCGGRRGL
jgi:hypothetical protein